MKIKRAIAQALALALIGAVAGLINNAFSVNGIDPFRSLEDVPVIESTEEPLAENGDTPDGICFISLEEVVGMLEEGLPVIDARTAHEYESGHIPGAILCDYFEMGHYFETVLPRLDPEQRIGVYCAGPDCDDSEMLARELFTLGYRKLCVFKGGIEEWTEAGMELEHGPEEVWE